MPQPQTRHPADSPNPGPNRILYNYDCLDVLNDELALPSNSVDLIYLDPPFNSKSHYNLPFAGKDRDTRPVEAFDDTWTWGDKEDEALLYLGKGPETRRLADIVRLAQTIDRSRSLAAYLVNMATRLIPMRRALAPTGSIYLHCDDTASHYLKLVMDVIFGRDNFRNEIVWSYRRWPTKQPNFQRMHDVIFRYSKGSNVTWNQLFEPLAKSTLKTWGTKQQVADFSTGRRKPSQTNKKSPGAPMRDVWDISIIAPIAKERLGYPTQKPLALLRRIIAASSRPGDLVLDHFCGCGTAAYAAEDLGRRWVGIDISAFAVGLMRERILRKFEHLTTDDVLVRGFPVNISDAEDLARRDKFEFEKWVCGAIGAEGMFHDPGQKGPDGGVDGVLRFYPFRMGKKPKPEYAIVQVKGGNVTADSVKALKSTVERFDATAGVMVCFARHMQTVENQRSRAMFRDDAGSYPVIQGYSIEDLLVRKPLALPLYGLSERRGGRISAQYELNAQA